jgi:glycerol-3-phosphate dehydrogenase
VHGGVRYLAQGNLPLVREALRERAAILANAPHVAQRLPFIVPGYHFWEPGWYGLGLKVYDALAARQGIGATRWLSARQTLEALPGARADGLVGGVRYWDGQFEDARLALLLARTAAARGACVLNHTQVMSLRHDQGQIRGLVVRDAEGGTPLEVEAGCVINATGVWVDNVRALDRAAAGDAPAARMVAPSQGVHLVVDRAFLPGEHALMVPRTADGRVLFAVPWLGKLILGTTDTPRDDVQAEPRPFVHEVDFILDEAARYLVRVPTRSDVRSAWVGLRPLVRPVGEAGETKALSREHTVVISPSGLVTVTGGKWTTYRAMAEDVLSRCMSRGLLAPRPAGATEHLPLLGAGGGARHSIADPPGDHLYGTEAATLRSLPGAAEVLWRDAESGQPGLTAAMVRFAVRHELARTVEDILARRCRLLFLDARAAEACAEAVADILAQELGEGFDAAASLRAFRELARRYQAVP